MVNGGCEGPCIRFHLFVGTSMLNEVIKSSLPNTYPMK